MSFSMNRIFGFVALAGTLGVATSQAGVQGTFHLPVAAHWGQAFLKPGDYRISVMSQSLGMNQIMIEGSKSNFYAMPLVSEAREPSSKGSLQLVELNGNYFVKEFRSEFSAKTYIFGVPKHASAHSPKTLELKD